MTRAKGNASGGRQTHARSARAVTLDAVEIRRHRRQLRTGAALIVSTCDRLLEDAMGADGAPLRDTLSDAMMAGRQIIALTQAALPRTRQSMTAVELTELFKTIEEPRDRVLHAVTRLLKDVDEGRFDEAVAADLLALRASAMQLLARDAAPVEAATAPILIPPWQEVPAPAPAPSPERRTQPRRPESAPRILVAEDSDDARQTLTNYLRKRGYIVDAVENGELALGKLSEESYDLILSDIEMPIRDGFGLLTALKASPETRDIPVIMISALDDTRSVVRCIEAGADEHLPKPFERVLLDARVNALLERKRLRDAEAEYLFQVRRVTAAAAAVEEQMYDSSEMAAIATRDDDLGKLARVFDSMASGVKVREERLSRRLRALQTEISRTQQMPRTSSAKATQTLLTPGERFADRYEILELAGEGGMGAVYRARDDVLGEDVAVKTVHQELVTENPMFAERLKNELRLARRLSHRNIVRCHDFGESRGVYYLTMEFVQGTTVRDLIDRRGRLSVPSAIAVAMQLADALATAHEHGVIHRDIKPENLLTTQEGLLKVMDFGVARLSEPGESMTAAGFVVGTPAYMAPERLVGADISPSSDLYSMGVVLYECLTGRIPIDADSPVALVTAILTANIVPVSALNPQTPPVLATLVMRLLAREAKDRPANASAIADALRAMA